MSYSDHYGVSQVFVILEKNKWQKLKLCPICANKEFRCAGLIIFLCTWIQFHSLIKPVVFGFIADDQVVLNHYHRRNPHQRWVLRGTKIQSLDEADIVIGLLESNNVQEGATVHAVDYDGSDNQQWDYDHTWVTNISTISDKSNGPINLNGQMS